MRQAHLVTMPYKSKYAINSFYGLITAGYKDFLFADLNRTPGLEQYAGHTNKDR